MKSSSSDSSTFVFACNFKFPSTVMVTYLTFLGTLACLIQHGNAFTFAFTSTSTSTSKLIHVPRIQNLHRCSHRHNRSREGSIRTITRGNGHGHQASDTRVGSSNYLGYRSRHDSLIIRHASAGGIHTTDENTNESDVDSGVDADADADANHTLDSDAQASNDNPQTKQQEPNSLNPKFDLNEVNVRVGSKIKLVYDPGAQRYIDIDTSTATEHNTQSIITAKNQRKRLKFKNYMKQSIISSFVPEGISPNYYKFIKWRIIQRFLSSNVSVFGTQSLLMGLGIKSKHASTLGLSAALNWVLKDALGKIVRMVWASRMGRKFDPDAKRWRYRSSLLYAVGNGLEVLTYVYPSLFLLLATLANSLKQMSLLTSSSTRNAVYNSFASKENIGDITAKGEAQIAFVDLFGIASGIFLSRAIGTSVQAVLSIYFVLQIFEVTCVYKQLRAVIFQMLNFERLWKVTNCFLDEVLYSESVINGEDLHRVASDIPVPTPEQVAEDERIFLPPNHLARRAVSFGSLGRAKLDPNELHQLISIFSKERYLLVVGKDIKNKQRTKTRKWRSNLTHAKYEFTTNHNIRILAEQMKKEAQENCHIVLHVDANNGDIVKSTLALSILRRKMIESLPTLEELETMSANGADVEEFVRSYGSRRSRDCMDLVDESQQLSEQLFGTFLKVLSVKKWATPARFMFGRVHLRAEWRNSDEEMLGVD